MFKISASSDPKTQLHASVAENSTTTFNGRPELSIFKILKYSEPSLLGVTSSTLQPQFLSGGLLW